MTRPAKSTVTINGKEYNIANLTDEARAHLTNLRITDADIRRLNAQHATAKTARAAYLRALMAELPEQPA